MSKHVPHVTLVVTGSIAAVKAYELIESLRGQSIELSVVLTDAAQHWVTLQAVSGLGIEVMTTADRLPVKECLGTTDAVLVAPASADFISRLALEKEGVAHDMRQCGKPVHVAPAMNVMMWNHPAVQRNVKKLLSENVRFMGPVEGKMACGDYGPGRFMEPADIAGGMAAAIAGTEHPAFAVVERFLLPAPQLPAIDTAPAKRALLLIQGGQDALGSYALISRLRAGGYDVTCAMNHDLSSLLPPQGLATISTNPTYMHHYQHHVEGMEHIRLPEAADVVIVAPATAEGVHEMVQGGGASFLGCIYLATKKPVILVPSVDPQQTPALSDLERLKADGVAIVQPPKAVSPVSKERAQALVQAIDGIISGKRKESQQHGT